MPFDSEHLFTTLKQLGINTKTIEHEPLRTVEEAKCLRGEIDGGHVKNLFLKDKQKRYWLIVALEDAIINLKQTALLLEAQKFSFANADELYEYLGILPGAVSPFALINDTNTLVSLVLDERMLQVSPLNFHPLRNDQTTTIATHDLLKFLEQVKHSPQVVKLPD